ncbi:MAG: DUF362 domain-containing protein [Bacteroidales bacterium]|jgi:uncharacterized protein (DUF362 family)
MKKIRRRDFLRTGLMAGGAVVMGSGVMKVFSQDVPAGETPDIVTISGDDPLDKIVKLLEPLGGIGQFVSKGQTVGILVNSPWRHPGYYTNPDVAIALAALCLEAGAKEIVCFKPVPDGYWERSEHYEEYAGMIEKFRYGSERVKVSIPKGIALKEAEIFRVFNEVDVYISIPVAKHHAGTIFSGNLKGLMGVSSRDTNRYMHSPDSKFTYDNHEHLAQCIADLNLIRLPDLCVVDAIECALNNGPAGPGETIRPNKIVAGIDPLALDVYTASLIGFELEDVLTFDRAYQLGLGKIDASKLIFSHL